MHNEDTEKEKALNNLLKIESEIESEISSCILKIEQIGDRLKKQDISDEEKTKLEHEDDKLRKKIEDFDGELKQVQMKLREMGFSERGDEGWQ